MYKLPFLVLLATFQVSCQNYGQLELITKLPKTVKEVSGIAIFPNSNDLLMINDSRNPPEVYTYNISEEKNGHTVRVKNATNIDWEDLTTSPDGLLFIGDFGNNISNRTDLKIYSIANPVDIKSRRTKPKLITFSLEDQTEFPPKNKNFSFDIESFIYLNDHFYLFTRNRGKNFDGLTKIYKLPAREGDHKAKLIGSFNTGNNPKDCQITGAAIQHPTGKIALLSYNKVWIIDNYKDDDFTNGTVDIIKLGHTSKKESICFKSENELYIADERSRGEGRNLYLLKL
jgi:hypothetical protein